MLLTAAVAGAAEEPLVPPWMYVACAIGLLIAGYNVWRFRSGWRAIDPEKPGRTQLNIEMGFASMPILVAIVGLTLVLVAGPLAADNASALLGIGMLLGALLLVGGVLVSLKEYRRPSRWNRPPAWLVEARAAGRVR